MKIFTFSIIGIVIAAIIAGFFIVGSPKQERARRFDEERIQNLAMLQSEIVFYWQNKNILPQNLDVLRDDIRGVRPPHDPETGELYEYTIQAPESFTLCAKFNTAREQHVTSQEQIPAQEYYTIGDAWEHGAGRECFNRHIDKDIYKKKEVVQ